MRALGKLAVELEIEVPFHDVDLVQVVWHGHYLKYLENARWKLMQRLDFGLEKMLVCGYTWPIVGIQVKYLRACRYGDSLLVRASLVEYVNSLTVNYLVSDRLNGTRVARAQTRQVAVAAGSGILQFTSPPALVNCVRAALGDNAAAAASAAGATPTTARGGGGQP